jgi:hypothetical protein
MPHGQQANGLIRDQPRLPTNLSHTFDGSGRS